MADENEIDLYDSVDDNWKRESLDLYDDVESHSNSDTQRETKASSQNNYSGRRVATYIGNLRWWTTDQDLLDSLAKLDIKDILEVKFHENRQNGQSKGFAVVVFGSDKSAKDAMEKLPKSEIHGLAPIVTYCNKQNLNYFEQAAGGSVSNGNGNNNNNGNKLKTDSEMNRNNGPSVMGNNTSQMQIGSLGTNMRFPGNMGMPAIPGLTPNLLFNLSQYTQNAMNRAPNMMNMQNSISTPLNVPPGQMNMSLAAQRLMQQPGMMMSTAMQMGGGGGGGGGGPTPHLNPNFFNTGPGGPMMNSAAMAMGQPPLNQASSMTGQQYDAFGRPIMTSFNQAGVSPKVSDSEFEEILQRNKTVSSSAINRAVQDASAGDYASAIETLVTAISLIKQSKIAADNRCKVLINSLQDTLTGIESKSYGSRRRSNRRRSFSESSSEDDRDGSNEYGGSRRVLRSRSRDRHRRSRDYGGASGSTTANRSSQQQQQQSTSGGGGGGSGSADYFNAVRSTSSSDRYGGGPSNRYRH